LVFGATFLNDSREWKHAFELAQLQIVRRIQKIKNDPALDDLLGDLVAWLQHHSWNVCVFSLSAMSNQLSQWRAYCPSEGGYSLRFESVKFLRQLRAQGFELFRCEYDPDVQDKKIDEAISPILDRLSDLNDLTTYRAETVELIISAKSELLNQIALLAPILKHPDFREEAEWRAVKVVSFGDPGMGYHIKGAVTVPHFNLRLDATLGDFPIDQIVVGPGPHQALASRGLASLVDRAHVRIDISETPLRNL